MHLRISALLALAAAASAADPVPAEADAAWRDIVGDVARGYAGLARIDANGWRVAPERCALPPTARELMSTADDGTAHARKVYRLFLKDVDAYAARATADQPVGQAIVKEAHAPREVAGGDGERALSVDGRYATLFGDAPAELGGRWYVGGEVTALFLMIKVGEADVPGTDAGWIYATTTPDGARITSIGRVDDCMACHRDAPRDRVFGVRPSRVPPPERTVPASARTSATPPAAPPRPATAGDAGR